MVNITDFATRPPFALAPGDVLSTGRHRFQWVPTPHLPHGWDAGMLFEEQDRVLFCSDLFHQLGPREAVTRDDVVGRYGEAWKLRVSAPPERGKANQAALELLARTLGLVPGDLRLVTGHGGRDKTVEVTGLTADEAERRLALAG